MLNPPVDITIQANRESDSEGFAIPSHPSVRVAQREGQEGEAFPIDHILCCAGKRHCHIEVTPI